MEIGVKKKRKKVKNRKLKSKTKITEGRNEIQNQVPRFDFEGIVNFDPGLGADF